MRRLAQHCRRLLCSLKEQRLQEPSLCDLRLRTADDHLLRCHKAVVCANSPYFKAMLTSAFIEAGQSEVTVPFTADVLSVIIDFFYDGCIKLTVDNCIDLLEAADMLLAQDLIAECQTFVAQHLLDVINSEETLRTDSLMHLVPVVMKLPKVNLKPVLSGIFRWFVKDAHARLTSFTELQLAVIDRLQDDLEVRLVDRLSDEPSSRRHVYVNFQCQEQTFPHLLRFDGSQWSKCDWPQPHELPSNCEHFCIVDYGKSLLYCKAHGEPIQLREGDGPDRVVEHTTGTLIEFLKSESHIFLHKITRSGDRLKVFDRTKKAFHSLELPPGYALVKFGSRRIAEHVSNNEIFFVATLRIHDALQEGVFCFELDAGQPSRVLAVSALSHKPCERDIPTVFCGAPVVLSTRDRRAYVQHRPSAKAGQWRERLSFPLAELDPANYEIVYVFSSRCRLYLVVVQDQNLRVVCYADLQAAGGRDVTAETRFPRARLEYERGVIFCPEDEDDDNNN